ncbi:hypothetical protein BDM02DRAFT_3184741 [Thelephora ganbajun]|uniref:Uncharacterized protein n=1 Tax=Thelephora ganbajun TaxID=370292 RepID=A0ACB6ZNV4_THEGA|nr:hypothetical protein BDM02DRAFT_3184741 [Thelephora ganbajun]
MLQRCKPPTGWPGKLAIANSGGPDSTCLSFLLNETLCEIKERGVKTEGWFGELISLNVDHQFQSCSSEMSLRTSEHSRRLGIPHKTLQIPWGFPPYPVKPSLGQSFERIARDARYTLLLSGMRQYGADAIAFGHHADDQLETFLMRLANGTGFLGLGGTKLVRRFGMGDRSPGQMGYYGIDGMQRWIVRPLLSVSKDRVFATCDEHGLDYVTDETNFQPEITLRNAVRHALAGGSTSDDIHRDRMLRKIATNANRLGVPLSFSDGIESLRSLANDYASKIGMIETEAHTLLRDCTVPSPPSTILLSQDRLSRITNSFIQRSMVIRILRFVSPHPWGSHTAEGFRKSTGLDQIVASIFYSASNDTPRKRFAFSTGSHVLWTPVYVRPDGQLKYAKPGSGADAWVEGWLASRSPPYKCTNGPEGLEIDVTSLMLENRSSRDPVEVLYDNRFVLSFDPRAIPEQILERLQTSSGEHRLVVTTAGKYFLPRLILRSSNGNYVKEIGMSGPSPGVGSVPTVPEFCGRSFGASWISWRLARAFE